MQHYSIKFGVNMQNYNCVLLVNNIKLSPNVSHKEAFLVVEKRLKTMGINTKDLSYSVYRRSVDARKKNDVKLVYSISVAGIEKKLTQSNLKAIDGVYSDITDKLDISIGNEEMHAPPVVVGTGPCGLFAALLLAENGYDPIVLERGGSIKERLEAVNSFTTSRILDSNTNIQFGAGGAGTFSDGKLVTRTNDPLIAYVLSTFVDFGAPEEIKYIAKPHVGTDILASIVDKILQRITKLGGRVYYNTKFIDTETVGSKSYALTTEGKFEYSSLILAIGHSSRDTYQTLINSGYAIEAKPFSVGMRIEHLAKDIDKSMLGDFAGNENVGHAEYNLSTNTKERGVYTFCMCPGGEVVAATSENFGVVVNGMSKHARKGTNSNSAVVCSVFKEDYGATPEKAIEFQRKIERAAFKAGGADYSAPIITVGDFLSDRCSTDPSTIQPTYMNGTAVKLQHPSTYLPEFVCSSIKNALHDFDKKIAGFSAPCAVLTGAETRTSAPIRILRNNDTRLALGKDNVYPAGEGAGYAGGITSAAVDGIKTALAIMKRFKPFG